MKGQNSKIMTLINGVTPALSHDQVLTRRSILGSDCMMKYFLSLSLWLHFRYSLSAFRVPSECSECSLSALWVILKSSCPFPVLGHQPYLVHLLLWPKHFTRHFQTACRFNLCPGSQRRELRLEQMRMRYRAELLISMTDKNHHHTHITTTWTNGHVVS